MTSERAFSANRASVIALLKSQWRIFHMVNLAKYSALGGEIKSTKIQLIDFTRKYLKSPESIRYAMFFTRI